MSNNILEIDLNGSIDTYNSYESEKEIRETIKNSSAGNIVLNVIGVNYMSSTGVGAFVSLNKYCIENNKKLYILGMTNKVKEVFSLLGFLSFFKTIESIDEVGEEENSLFPISVNCPSCDKKLNIIKSGRFRCTSCKNIFRINKNGKLENE